MTATDTAALFRPLTVRGVTFPNRTVMAPMARGFAQDHVPHAATAAYYRRRVEGGVGLIMTEATGVDHPLAVDYPTVPVMHGAAALAAWKSAVDQVHAGGGLIASQLYHQGMLRGGKFDELPDSLRPSGTIGVAGPNSMHPGFVARASVPTRPMTDAEIADVIAAYARSARHAVDAGFDVVELHGAHGYMIDGFLWSESNRRTDRWGGDHRQRARFAAEVVRAVRAEMPATMPLSFRFSQHKSINYDARTTESPAELEAMLGPIVEAGADMLHASIRRFWQPAYDGSPLNLAGWARKVTGLPVIAVGSVGLSLSASDTLRNIGEEAAEDNTALLIERLEAGEFDMIAIGRSLLGDPYFVEKLRCGETPSQFTRDALAKLV